MSFLFGEENAPEPGAELHEAVAGVLVEAAMEDGQVDPSEETRIKALLGSHFGMSVAEAEAALERARQRMAGATQLYPTTRRIKDLCDADQRLEIMAMLWEVVYADGVAHDYEANLMRRVAGLLYVSDRDSGLVRDRVRERLGLTP